MGWREILRSPDPSRALYLAMRGNPTASRIADTFQGGFEGAMEGLSNLGQAATIPARALAGAATNMSGVSRPVNVKDYALFGKDLETGAPAAQYGDLLAGTLEDAGEMKPGGLASKLVRAAGNMVTDPGMAPAMLTGADALGALAGKMSPAMPIPEPTRAYRPMSSPGPRAVQSASRGVPPKPPGAPAAPPEEPPQNPTATQPVPRFSSAGEGWFDPNATQELPPLTPAQQAALAKARRLGQRG